VSSPAIPEPDYDDPREVYAFFGLAFYVAQVCEQGVVNLAVALHARKVGNVTSAMLASLFAEQEGRTFGQVLRSARQLLGVPAALDSDMDRVLQLRNQLAHSFFPNRSEQLLSDTGRRKAIDELIDIIRFIKKVNTSLDSVWLSACYVLGVTKEALDAEVQTWIDRAQRTDRESSSQI
jgi:hypothetical protein